ncbi:unnamed protein product [Brassicogethes aeneus]|uniref:Succinate--hydroxymethylglutarate CoA-transferase n=1 Tax=Brassicogethes aeneus TaxID=1431903 RepID=A0A9P0B8A3_BRAAE|nr:unnamed protein product [Brassicogethes aeneus]
MTEPKSSQTQECATTSTLTVTESEPAQANFGQIRCKHDGISPLEGIRVLDLTRIVAGPYCTMILSDLGAEVIKIERPGAGDEARKWGPPFIRNTPESCYFIALNRNKKSICVDLKSKSGQELLYELAKESDVLVENYVPGKLSELNLGYDKLKEIAPQLIYCSITGYGPTGPYSKKPGYDVIAASVGGLLHITGPQNGEPVKVGVAVTDLATGLYAHGAIMAALIKRTKTKCGQKIDCNLLSTQVASLINIGSNYLNANKEASRWGTAHESIVPYEAFPTKDGYFTIGTGSDKQFKDFCERINKPELSENKKFLTNKLRVKNRGELLKTLRECLIQKTNKEWFKIFEGAQFPCGPINTLQETFNDEHIKSIGLVKTMEHPIAGEIKVVGPPVEFSEGGNIVRNPPPTLGQHTDEILRDILCYNNEKILDLRKNNDVPTLTLKLRKPRTDRKVQWSNETIDNEHLNRKKSKCCCIYDKPKKFGESSSSESSEDECDHCHGHVEKKKKKRTANSSDSPPRPPDLPDSSPGDQDVTNSEAVAEKIAEEENRNEESIPQPDSTSDK